MSKFEIRELSNNARGAIAESAAYIALLAAGVGIATATPAAVEDVQHYMHGQIAASIAEDVHRPVGQ